VPIGLFDMLTFKNTKLGLVFRVVPPQARFAVHDRQSLTNLLVCSGV
jgi:ribosomal protein S4E